MTKLNKALMASTAIAFASGLALPASAQDPSAAPGVVSSQKKVQLRLYGQISRAFGFVGDGESVTFKQGENGNTATRMGIDGRGKITNDISVRTRMEYEVSSGDSLGGSQFESQAGTSNFAVRHLDVIVSSKKFGSVWMGRGDSSSNGSSEVSVIDSLTSGRLGGTVSTMIEDLQIMSDDSNTEPQAIGSVSRFLQSFDGANRQNRLRYDTPTFFGFKGSVSIIDKHNFDSAIWYEGKLAGTEIQGAVGFCHTEGAQGGAGSSTCFGNGTTINGITQLNGSVSMLTPIGIGATMAGARQWRELQGAGHTLFNNTNFNLQPAIFYTTKLTELGATTVEYAFQYCEDCGTTSTGTKDDVGIGHSLQLMQEVDSIGGDYFVTFRYIDVEANGNDDNQGLWFVGGGFRQKF